MAKVVETRIKVGVDTTGGDQAQATIGAVSQSAKAAQQSFESLEAAQESAYAGITALSQESQNQLNAVTESFTKLRAEMENLPEALRSTVDGILKNLSQQNLQAATAITATPVYQKAPEAVQQQVAQIFQGTYELAKTGVGVDFDRMAPAQAEPPQAGGSEQKFNRARWNRLSNSYEGRLDTFERGLAGAEGDLDTLTPGNTREMRRKLGEIGELGRQTRGASGPAQEQAVNDLDERFTTYTSRLDDLLRQRAERGHQDDVEQGGPNYEQNFQQLFDKRLRNIGEGVGRLDSSADDSELITMERRLQRAGGDLSYHKEALPEKQFESFSAELKSYTDTLSRTLGSRRAENTEALADPFDRRLGGLDSELDSLDPYTASRRKLSGLRGRVNEAADELASYQGALEPEVFEALTASVQSLTDKMDENVRAYNESERGDPLPATGEGGGGGGGGIGDMIMGQLSRMGGGGGLLGKLLPGGAVIGGAVAGYNILDRQITNANREGREAVVAQADLARQYGIEDDPWTMFRSDKNGLSDVDLVRLGYTGRDAERVMSQLDRPSSRGAAVEDTADILQFSRATGLDEGRVTDAVRSLGMAGNYKPGGAETPLETLKMALTESVKNGVSQADTMNALVSLSERALAEGRRLSPEALAFNASLQKVLADRDDPVLKGPGAAELNGQLNDMITGAGDPAMQMLVAPALEGVTPEELGLEGDAARGFREMQQYDPLTAAFDALDLLKDGRNPELLAKVAGRFEDAMGSNPTMMNHQLQGRGVSTERRYAIMGSGGLGELYSDAADGTPAMFEGEALSTDVQGENDLSRESLAIKAMDLDEKEAQSRANVEVTGTAERNLKNIGYLRNQIMGRLKMGARNDPVEGVFTDTDTPTVDFTSKAFRPFGNRDEIEAAPPAPPPAPEGDPAAADNAPRRLAPEPDVLYALPQPDADVVDEVPAPEPKAGSTNTPPRAPTPRAPDAPDIDVSKRVGALAYGVMASGLEGTTGDASNTRTGAFGFSQVMPANLIGDHEPGEGGMLVSGWDTAFMKTKEGKKWQRRFDSVGLDSKDPIHDGLAELAVNDPNVLPSWYQSMTRPQQAVMDGFMGDMTKHQLGTYYDTARADGAKPDEALKRTFAGWYGGSGWLDNDDPKYALDEENPAYTRGHGVDDQEPSIREYALKGIERGDFDFLNQREVQAQPQEMRVTVVHQGLENVRVSGLEGRDTRRLEAATRDMTKELGDLIRTPESHHGP